MSEHTRELRIMAIVLTHNAPRALRRCLDSIDSQTRPPDRLLVIDNASRPPATVAAGTGGIAVDLIYLNDNLGPAGGHARGLQTFVASECDAAWVMDDDCVPAPDCLELLITEHSVKTPSLLYPRFVDEETGRALLNPSWSGFLVSREIVETVGLPNEDLFWWKEDTEYLAWRIPQAGFPVARSASASVSHRGARSGPDKPPWRIYYEVRNTVYFLLYVRRDPGRKKLKRFFTLGRSLVRTFGRILIREPDKRSKFQMYLRGLSDGVRRRLGKRYDAVAREIDHA